MKILITYYSRTGTTKVLAKKISKKIKADIDEIEDEKDRSGFSGFIITAIDSLFKISTQIKTKKNPENYDLVIIGTPVNIKRMSPAIRTYITKYKFKNTALFSTTYFGETKHFNEMTILSRKPLATLAIKSNNIFKKETDKKINEFVGQIKNEIKKRKK